MRHTLKTIIGTALAAGMLTATVGVLPAFAESAQAAPATSVVAEAGTAHAVAAATVADHVKSAAEPYETDPAKDSDVKSVEHDGITQPWAAAVIAAFVFIISGGVSILAYRRSR